MLQTCKIKKNNNVTRLNCYLLACYSTGKFPWKCQGISIFLTHDFKCHTLKNQQATNILYNKCYLNFHLETNDILYLPIIYIYDLYFFLSCFPPCCVNYSLTWRTETFYNLTSTCYSGNPSNNCQIYHKHMILLIIIQGKSNDLEEVF